jgi:hypothetical protein
LRRSLTQPLGFPAAEQRGPTVVANEGDLWPLRDEYKSQLQSELARADSLGYEPAPANSPDFHEAIQQSQGIIKWAVLPNNQLVIIPKLTGRGEELYHTVLTRGGPVRAAGEADIDVVNGTYLGRHIDNHSGHYRPGKETLEIGRKAFSEQAGINFP